MASFIKLCWLFINGVAVSAFFVSTSQTHHHEKDCCRRASTYDWRGGRRDNNRTNRRNRQILTLPTSTTGNDISSNDQDGDVDLPRLISLFGGSPNDLLRFDGTEVGGGGIRGIYVNQPIRQGKLILKMPLSSCLRDDQPPEWLLNHHQQQQRSEEEEDNSDAAVQIQNWVTRLAACVLEKHQEQEEEESSLHRAIQAWLQLLPSRSSFQQCLPIYWPEPFVSAMVDYRPLELAVDAAYFARASPLADLTEAIPSSYYNRNKNNEKIQERIEWALDVVQTRSCRCSHEPSDNAKSVDKDSLRVLVPVFDMINHSPEPNAEFFRKDDHMVVRAISDIAADEQVCIHYGGSTVPAWKRLFSYGFCDTGGNDSDHFAVYEDDTVEIVLEDRFRFEVSPTEISEDLIQYQAQRASGSLEGTTTDYNELTDIDLTPEIGQGIVDQLTTIANYLEQKRDDVANEAMRNKEASMSASLRLVVDLHESHRRTLLSCAGGLREHLQEDQE